MLMFPVPVDSIFPICFGRQMFACYGIGDAFHVEFTFQARCLLPVLVTLLPISKIIVNRIEDIAEVSELSDAIHICSAGISTWVNQLQFFETS
jgi:hypothetical protein